jgi:hypothetical protein
MLPCSALPCSMLPCLALPCSTLRSSTSQGLFSARGPRPPQRAFRSRERGRRPATHHAPRLPPLPVGWHGSRLAPPARRLARIAACAACRQPARPEAPVGLPARIEAPAATRQPSTTPGQQKILETSHTAETPHIAETKHASEVRNFHAKRIYQDQARQARPAARQLPHGPRRPHTLPKLRRWTHARGRSTL